MQPWTSLTMGGQLRTSTKLSKNSGQGWIEDAQRLCLNSKEAALHCIIRMHARRAGLGHLAIDFKQDEPIFHLICTYPALDRWRKRHLWAYYMEEIDELLWIDIGNLSCFI